MYQIGGFEIFENGMLDAQYVHTPPLDLNLEKRLYLSILNKTGEIYPDSWVSDSNSKSGEEVAK